MQPVLRIDGAGFSYGSREILRGLDLAIDAGRSAAITGRSGAGKSTVLSLIAGLIRPRCGTITVGGLRVETLRRGVLARFRRRQLGIVFQAGELLPALSAVENVAMPLMLDGAGWLDAMRSAQAALVRLGVDPESRQLPAASLSGGERQRTAVARAIVAGPRLIIADEPTGALDAQTRDTVAELLFGIPASCGCALLVVTHDPAIAERADERFELSAGSLRLVSPVRVP